MREEEKRTSQSSSFKRFFKKRWVFPALYIASAAIILTGVLWYQSYSSSTNKYGYNNTDGNKYHQPAIEVSRSLENFVMPVSKTVSSVVDKPFYDSKAKKEDQEAALILYDNTKFIPNTGIDLKAKNGATFDVLASLSGTVTKVNEDPFLGNVIEIEHDKGVTTQYQSVKDFAVQVGEQVDQGTIIAKAGQSLINEKAGVHVHFEIRKDGMPVNPQSFFNKPLSALQTDSNNSKTIGNTGQTGNDGSDHQKSNQSNKTKDTTGNMMEKKSTDTTNNTNGDVHEKKVIDSGTNKQNNKVKSNDSNSNLPSTDSSLNNTNS